MGNHEAPDNRPDTIPPGWRFALYTVAVISPLGGVALGHIDADDAAALVVALAGVLGPIVAMAYDRATPSRPPREDRTNGSVSDDNHGPINQ